MVIGYLQGMPEQVSPPDGGRARRPYELPLPTPDRYEALQRARRSVLRCEECADGTQLLHLADGSVQRLSVDEVAAERQAARQRAQDLPSMQEMIEQLRRAQTAADEDPDGPPSPISVRPVELPQCPLSDQQHAELRRICDQLSDDTLPRPGQVALAEQLNALIADRWGALPLFEALEDPYSPGGWTVGYRANALEAFVLPRVLDDDDDEPLRWAQLPDGAACLDGLLEMLADGDDEVLEPWGWLAERGPDVPLAHVRAGRVYRDEDWKQLIDAQAHRTSRAALTRPAPVASTPLMRCCPVRPAMLSVASAMADARAADAWDSATVDRVAEQLIADRAALRSMPAAQRPFSDERARELRRADVDSRAQELWQALTETLEHGYALLPAWSRTQDEQVLACLDGGELAVQMEAYRRAHPDLQLAPLPGRQAQMPAPHPRPAAQARMHQDPGFADDPLRWYAHVSEADYSRAVGGWVVIGQFGPARRADGDVLGDASGPLIVLDDPADADACGVAWHLLVSVPADGSDGEVIINPDAGVDDSWQRPDGT